MINIPQLMYATDVGALNLALASVAEGLQVDVSTMPWIATTYSLVYAGFLILGGRICDLYGRRRVCILGISGFVVGSLVAATSFNLSTFIAGRAIAGFSSAMMLPATFSLINTLLPPGPARNRAFSLFALTNGLAMFLGTSGGGALTTMFGWRSIFLITIPMGIAALVLAHKVIPRSEDGQRDGKSLDIGGAILITLCVGCSLMSLTFAGRHGWFSMQTFSMLIAAGLLLAAFVAVERYVREPVLPAQIFKYPNVLGANLACICSIAGSAGFQVVVILYMQRQLGFTPLTTGLGMLSYAATIVLASSTMGYLLNRFPVRRVVITGELIALVGLVMLALAPADGTYLANLLPGIAVYGFGSTYSTIPLMALSTRFIPNADQGVGVGALKTFQQFGISIGISVGLAVLAYATTIGLPASFSFRYAFFALIALVVLGLAFVVFLTRDHAAPEAHIPVSITPPRDARS